MQDDQNQQIDQQQTAEQSAQPQESILNQTFGEVLQNPEAQERIMKAMHIGPEQFQQLLKSTEGNPIANMSVGELFNSGFVQQAVKAQGGTMPTMEQVPQQMEQTAPPDMAGANVTPLSPDSAEAMTGEQGFEEQAGQDIAQEEQELDPEQFQQMVESGNAQVLETDEMGNPTKIAVEQPQPEPQKQSWWDIIKSAFK
jgi:hypothetical protein